MIEGDISDGDEDKGGINEERHEILIKIDTTESVTMSKIAMGEKRKKKKKKKKKKKRKKKIKNQKEKKKKKIQKRKKKKKLKKKLKSGKK